MNKSAPVSYLIPASSILKKNIATSEQSFQRNFCIIIVWWTIEGQSNNGSRTWRSWEISLALVHVSHVSTRFCHPKSLIIPVDNFAVECWHEHIWHEICSCFLDVKLHPHQAANQHGVLTFQLRHLTNEGQEYWILLLGFIISSCFVHVLHQGSKICNNRITTSPGWSLLAADLSVSDWFWLIGLVIKQSMRNTWDGDVDMSARESKMKLHP